MRLTPNSEWCHLRYPELLFPCRSVSYELLWIRDLVRGSGKLLSLFTRWVRYIIRQSIPVCRTLVWEECCLEYLVSSRKEGIGDRSKEVPQTHPSVKQNLWCQAAFFPLQGWLCRPASCLLKLCFANLLIIWNKKRLYGGRGIWEDCEFCFSLSHVSFPLQLSFFFMNYFLSNTTVSYSVGWGVEVDIERHFNAISLHPLRLDFVFAFQICRVQAHCRDLH